MFHVKQKGRKGKSQMKKEMEMLFVVYFDECYSYYSDVRCKEDETSLAYDHGVMSALGGAVLLIGGIMNRNLVEKVLAALKDEAKRDEAEGNRKTDAEVAALANALMKAAV